MRIRAAIFDVYGTLLELGPAPGPAEVEHRWEALCHEHLSTSTPPNLTELTTAWKVVIAREHALAGSLGIRNPEIFWPDVIVEVLPAVGRLPANKRDLFLAGLAGLSRSVRLAAGADRVLKGLQAAGIRLGIASNAQPYTLAELSGALETAGLTREVFLPSLCFWSFENGFSKPNPHVFRMLTARLWGFGIRASETLMVGDRTDNDIEPARAFGWQTWQLHPAGNGSWADFACWLDSTSHRSAE